MPRNRTRPASTLQGTKRVTAIVPDKRLPGNLVVEINETRFASLPVDVVTSLRIVTDRELSDDLYEKLLHAADVEAAYLVAVRMLAARPRAVNELLRRLRDRGHNPAAAARAVGRLETRGVLDDAEFSRHFTRTRLARSHGPPRILTDLLARGIDRRVAERAIDEVVDQEEFDGLKEARTVTEKRLAQLGDLPPDRLTRRLLAYLARRGYRGWEMREMVSQLIRERGSETGDVSWRS